MSFTWKWDQESAQNIPHSAPKDIAPDFREGAICRTGQVRPQQSRAKGLVLSQYVGITHLSLWTRISHTQSLNLPIKNKLGSSGSQL
jgi:hypothetical protein